MPKGLVVFKQCVIIKGLRLVPHCMWCIIHPIKIIVHMFLFSIDRVCVFIWEETEEDGKVLMEDYQFALITNTNIFILYELNNHSCLLFCLFDWSHRGLACWSPIVGCYLFTYEYSTYWCMGQIISSYHNYYTMCFWLVRCLAAN